MTNFWEQLETKQLGDKNQVEQYLFSKLGQPTNQTQTNLYQEIVKKINAYYFSQEIENYTVYSLIGSLTSPEQVIEKRFKEGKYKGQTYYLLKLTNKEQLIVRKELLPSEKWTLITNLAILNQNLVFKYKKWITNKELLDFMPYENAPKSEGLPEISSGRTRTG
jgi:hypothetical protein